MKVKKQKSHWMVQPEKGTGLFSIKNQYSEYVREHTPDGVYDYSPMLRCEDNAERIAADLNSGVLQVDTDKHNTIK